MKEIYPGVEGLKTVSGHLVRIYAIDGDVSAPIHGAVRHEWEKRWALTSWDRRGFNFDTSDWHIDLADWRDEIPWDCLADWVQWVARDADKHWRAFEAEPALFPPLWSSRSRYKQDSLDAVKMPAGPDNWRQAIARRPN